MSTAGAILIIIGVLGILYSAGWLTYCAGHKAEERKQRNANKKEAVLWSKIIRLPGFKILIYRIKYTER